MIEPAAFAGLPVAVFGLGRSGLVAARALAAAGAEVWAWDDDEDQRARAAQAEVPLVDLSTCAWDQLTTLVLSPGVPLTHPKPHPVVERARAAGCEVVGDVELLARTMHNPRYIGVTGTNGKSTTTALVGHILSVAGRDAEVGGNLGPPVLELHPLDHGGVYVLEMSSYQLDLTFTITFDVAVLLNVTPDHIERHGDFDNYARVKQKIFHRQTDPRAAVVCVDDETCRGILEELRAHGDQRFFEVAVGRRVKGGVYVIEGVLHDDTEGHAAPVIDLNDIATLPGAHNWQNAAAAFAAARAEGVAAAVAAACLRSFGGLAHRMEQVAVIDGVRYVNDSKATNAAAAGKALDCYRDIYWIVGGRPKEGGIGSLESRFERLAHAFPIGEAAAAFAATLGDQAPCTECGDLATAVAEAAAGAKADGRAAPVVLLSPACASFDQFADFEARGDAFRALVESLPGEHAQDVEHMEPGATRAGKVR